MLASLPAGRFCQSSSKVSRQRTSRTQSCARRLWRMYSPSSSCASPATKNKCVPRSLKAHLDTDTGQVNSLKFELADILEREEDWSGAARVLRGINFEASQRCVHLSQSTRAPWSLTNSLLTAQTKRNSKFTSALSACFLRRRIPCKQKLIIIALHLSSIPLTTAKLSCPISSVKPASVTMRESS